MSKVTGNSPVGSVKRLLYTNTVTLAVILCVLCVGPYISASLSVVGSVKVVVEVLCCYLLAANILLNASLRDVELPPYRSQRTASSKVKMPNNKHEYVMFSGLENLSVHIIDFVMLW